MSCGYINGQQTIVSTITPANGSCFSEVLHCSLRSEMHERLASIYCPTIQEQNSNLNRPVVVTKIYGSKHGIFWNDIISSCDPIIVGIRSIELYHDSLHIISIQVSYLLADGSVHTTSKHGGSGGSRSVIVLAMKEHITRVEGSTDGSDINHLSFMSLNSEGTQITHGPYGAKTEQMTFHVDGYILGFTGYSLSTLHGFGVYYLPRLIKLNETYGGTCMEHSFDDAVDRIIPPVVGIRSIKMHHILLVHAIQNTYELLGGSLHKGNLVGNISGCNSSKVTVTLNNNDDIVYQVNTTVSRAFPKFLSGLTILTRFMTYGLFQKGENNSSWKPRNRFRIPWILWVWYEL